ncbi:MAG: xylulose kinase, partial [Caldilinea sp.]|nr:xylulose kinase [Caldilinea sp.]
LGGRASPVDPDQRGAWLGITWTHGPAHFYRAVLESIAYDYAGALAELRALAPGLRVDGVRVIGGGARSRVWNQIKADVLGIPYAPLRRPDVTTWGCAILAGHAAGIFPDMAAVARRSVDQGEMVAPR